MKNPSARLQTIGTVTGAKESFQRTAFFVGELNELCLSSHCWKIANGYGYLQHLQLQSTSLKDEKANRLQDDFIFSPTLLNHFNMGFTRYDVANANTSVGFNTSSLGIPANATQNAAFPRIDFPGYGDPTNSSDPRAVQNIGSSFFTERIRDNTFEPSDFVTYVRGRQTMKFGVDFRTSQFNVTQLIDPGGSFNFRNDQTAADRDPNGGYPIASLITGATEFAFNSNNSIQPQFRQFQQSYFFQDDIKVKPNLTLNLGLRYDLPGLRYEARNRFRTFDPNAVNPIVGRLGALAGAGGQKRHTGAVSNARQA